MKKDSLKFIGVTGTNGKTTTSFLIYHLLKRMGQKVALIGTVKYIIGAKRYKAALTTPDAKSLEKLIKEIKKQGISFVVLEVSSHGIFQERIKYISFTRCVFTNLSRDHLDYHKTMKNYFNTKKKFFLCNKKALSFINIDDSYGRKLFKELNNKLSYGTKGQAVLRANNIKLFNCGSKFDLSLMGKTYPVTSRLCGRHNILNILAAFGVVQSLGFPLAKLIKPMSYLRPVQGRLECVKKDIFVDYAHTPDGLLNVLCALSQIGYSKIICIFGCGGDRDKGKRKIMGQVAAKFAYFTFITSDNPRTEMPLKICLDIEKGFKKKSYSIILDRREAMQKAIKLFKRGRGDCVLIAGKGHENYQIIGNKKIPFKDSKVVKQILKDVDF